MPRVRVGISGWTYAGWRGDFYPRGLAHRRELEYAAARMSSVEINGSFYSLQRPSSYGAWREQTPDDFVLAVKGGRYLTHMLRLRGVESALANFFASGVLALGPKLGPVLWQLPEALAFDADAVAGFLALLPRSTGQAAALAERHDDKLAADRALTSCELDVPIRHALEFRSPTFDTPAAADVLREHQVTTVLADSAGRFPVVDQDTGPIRYVRLHGHTELYASGYSEAHLDAWAERCLSWAEQQDVYVYFDNDARGRAPYDAMGLRARVDRA